MVQRYYEAAGEPKSIWQITDVGHGGGITTYPDEYRRRMLEFFDTALHSE